MRGGRRRIGGEGRGRETESEGGGGEGIRSLGWMEETEQRGGG